MKEAAKQSDRTIAVLSPAYLKSPNAQAEWAAAFAEDPTGAKRKLIPIQVRECDLSGLDKPIVFINFVGKSPALCKELLLAELQEGRLKPKQAPPFPGLTEAYAPTAIIPATSPDTPVGPPAAISGEPESRASSPNRASAPPAGPAFPGSTLEAAIGESIPSFTARYDPPAVLVGELHLSSVNPLPSFVYF
jgi:hypothetical protein